MLSRNEWDPLKTVIVGIADDAKIPVLDPSLRIVNYADKKHVSEIPYSGLYPKQVIDESNEDLETLALTLQSLGVEVIRPDPLNFQVHDGLYNYCPRDRLLVYGDTIVDPAMMYPCRDMEYQSYIDIISDADHIYHMPRKEGMVLDAANVLQIGRAHV